MIDRERVGGYTYIIRVGSVEEVFGDVIFDFGFGGCIVERRV